MAVPAKKGSNKGMGSVRKTNPAPQPTKRASYKKAQSNPGRAGKAR
jgi:hypothetical protein